MSAVKNLLRGAAPKKKTMSWHPVRSGPNKIMELIRQREGREQNMKRLKGRPGALMPLGDIIMKGTLKEVVVFLVSRKDIAEMYDLIFYFVASCNKFCSTDELITLLYNHIDKCWSRVGLLLEIWITKYFIRDFCKVSKNGVAKTRKVYKKLLLLVDSLEKQQYNKDSAKRVKLAIVKHLGSFEKKVPKKPVPEYEGEIEFMEFTNFKPKEVAQHLTLMEFEMFKSIGLSEFFNHGWSSADRLKVAPNIVKMVDFSNRISYWVASLIVQEPTARRRIKVMQRLIAVAKYCKRLNNFNTLLEIVCGIGMWAVEQLEVRLPKRYHTALCQLRELINPLNNWYNYRMYLKTVKGPVLPYLGVFLKDITFVEDGNKDFFSDGVINFDKVMLMGEQLAHIDFYQKSEYLRLISLKNPALSKYVHNLPVFTEEDLEQMSTARENFDWDAESCTSHSTASTFMSYTSTMMEEEDQVDFFND